MQPANEMKQPAVPFDDKFVNKLKQLRFYFVLENSVLFTIRTSLMMVTVLPNT